jgi:hypothetical protein
MLLASTWLVVGCQRTPSAPECPKECTCSGAFQSCFYRPSHAELEADAAVERIPALALQKLGSSRFENDIGRDHDDKAYSVAVDAMGRIHMIGVSSDTVHVFDDTGRQLWTGRSSKPFGPERYPALMMKVTSRGDTWVEEEESSKSGAHNMALLGPRYVHFGPSGQPLGVEQILFEGDTWWAWLPQPDGGLRWVINHKKILLVDAHGALLQSIPWPIDEALIDVQDDTSAVAPDGSLAVVRERAKKGILWFSPSKELVAGIFSPQGDAITEWPLPFHSNSYPRIAFDGRHLAFVVSDDSETGHQAILVSDAKGKGLFRLPVAANASVAKVFLLTRATGEELWVFAKEQVTRQGWGVRDGVITRYAMPR